jgi:ATP-dependent protease ClpP protease subunit
MKTVVLKGYIDADLVSRTTEQIADILEKNKDESISLEIDSDGGNMAQAIKFLKYVKIYVEGTNGTYVSVKIVNAKSSAALVALSLGHKRVMKKDSVLELHRGTLQIEVKDIDVLTGRLVSGKLPEKTLAVLQDYTDRFLDLLKNFRIDSNPGSMAKLRLTGWLKLSAEECLRLGMVDELF